MDFVLFRKEALATLNYCFFFMDQTYVLMAACLLI